MIIGIGIIFNFLLLLLLGILAIWKPEIITGYYLKGRESDPFYNHMKGDFYRSIIRFTGLFFLLASVGFLYGFVLYIKE